MKTGNSAQDFYFGETMTIKDIKVTTAFAEHSGAGYYVDQYTGYGFTGYVIEYKDKTIFYAGETISKIIYSNYNNPESFNKETLFIKTKLPVS